MKEIKILYRIENDIDFNCMDYCPFRNEENNYPMCGSVKCRECENCIGYGEEPIWDLSKKLGFRPYQGYIYCKKTNNKYTIKMRLMRIIHKIKMKFDTN